MRPQALPKPRFVVAGAVLAVLFAADADAQFGIPQNVNLGIGGAPDAITGAATGDLDGDGRADLVGVDSASPGNVGLALRTLAAYAVQPVVPGGASGSPSGLTNPVVDDLNGDGLLDLVAAGTTPFPVATHTALFVYRGSIPAPGQYTFTLVTVETIAPLPAETLGVTVTDLDGDGVRDLLWTSDAVAAPGRHVGNRRGLGGFTYGPLHSSSTVIGPADIDVCVDYNKDGRKDVVVCGGSPGNPGFVDLYAGTGTIPALPSTPTISLALPPGFSPRDVHWFECDQKPGYDLAVALAGPNPAVAVIRNLGTPPFFSTAAGAQLFPLANVPLSLLRAEVDFDGIEDLTVFSVAPGTAAVKGAGFEVLRVVDCSLQAQGATATGTVDTTPVKELASAHHAVGDQQPDGRLDLVVVDHSQPGQSRLRVYPSQTPIELAILPPRPRLGQVTPITFQIQVPSQPQRRFLVLFSLAGTTPGIALAPGLVLPLNAPLSPVVISSTTDISGNGSFTTPAVAFPPAPQFFSLQVAAAVVVQAGPGGPPSHVTNPAVITLP